MAQHRRANSSGEDSAVHLHLKEKNHSFEDNNVNILAREHRWFKRGVKESIYVKLEQPSLNTGGGLQHYLSPTSYGELSSLSRHLNYHSHLGSSSPSNPHEGKLGTHPTSGPNGSKTQCSHVSLMTL